MSDFLISIGFPKVRKFPLNQFCNISKSFLNIPKLGGNLYFKYIRVIISVVTHITDRQKVENIISENIEEE